MAEARTMVGTTTSTTREQAIISTIEAVRAIVGTTVSAVIGKDAAVTVPVATIGAAIVAARPAMRTGGSAAKIGEAVHPGRN